MKNKYWCCMLALSLMLVGCSDDEGNFQLLKYMSSFLMEKQAPITYEEAVRQKFRVSLEGIHFDIPSVYSYYDYKRKKSWPRVPADQLNGSVRKEIDFIKIIVVMPDMEGFTRENSSKFEEKGWGSRVVASVNHQIPSPWVYYFEGFFPGLKKQEPNPNMPGMLRFHDPLMRKDIYLSHNYARPDLIKIMCADKSKVKSIKLSPSCTVTAQYHNKLNFSYTFAREYLYQWRDIDAKLRQRFDSFIAN